MSGSEGGFILEGVRLLRGLESEPGRRPLTRPMRECVREKEKHHLPASIRLHTGMQRILFYVIFRR